MTAVVRTGPAGAVVLAGGRSSRMGTPKAMLEWHGSTLLRRVTGLVARGVDGPVVVVRAVGQPLPALARSVEVAEDELAERGPLAGLAAGLQVLRGQVETAFVCSTDLPWLTPALVRQIVGGLGQADIALPHVGGFDQPLVAVYRTSLAARAHQLLADGWDRPAFLQEGADVVRLSERGLLADQRLRRADPELAGVRGVNDPAAYARARAEAAPEVQVHRTGALATQVPAAWARAADATAGRETASRDQSSPARRGPSTCTVRAATLGAAALAVGLELGRHLLAAIDDDAVVRDPQTPLATDDTVSFLSADAGG